MGATAAVGGAVLVVFGVFGLCIAEWLWYEMVYKGDLRFDDVRDLVPVVTPVLGLWMAAWGNAIVVGAFRGGRSEDGGVNPALRPRAVQWAVWILLAVQVAVLGVQVWQLWRYDTAIAPYMPTMTYEGYAPVVTNFE